MNILALIIITFFFTGCSTMFNSTRQIVSVDSDPKGAKVFSRDMYRPATTPTTFSFDKGIGKDVNIRLEQDGYVPQEVGLYRSITPSYWANILNGWGFLIDFVTGAMWNYQETVYMKLEPLPSHSQGK